MTEIEFTEDFGGRKKGEIITVDSMLASGLIHRDKVAKLTEKEVERFEKLTEAGKAKEAKAVKAEAEKKAKKAAAKGKSKAKVEDEPIQKAPEKKSDSKDKTE